MHRHESGRFAPRRPGRALVNVDRVHAVQRSQVHELRQEPARRRVGPPPRSRWVLHKSGEAVRKGQEHKQDLRPEERIPEINLA
eukprot:289089-Heterocapsa_arctica.AAC.1